MTNPIDNLQSMSKQDLIALAHQHNIPVDGRAKSETIIQLIMEAYATKPSVEQKLEDQQPAAAKAKAPEHMNTEEEVLEAIRAYSSKPGFQVDFLDDGKSWHFMYHNKEDTGSMCIPLREIKIRAELVTKGARLVDARSAGFDTMVGKGYADQVIWAK